MAKSQPERRRRTGAGRKRPDEAMHLSHEDLTQLDESVLQDLEERVLRVLSVKLLADLKEAHERLAQNPSNSSRPPSSRAPWEGVAPDEGPSDPGQEPSAAARQLEGRDAPEMGTEDEPTPKSATDTPPKRPGQRPGRPGHGRTQRLQVHEERHHHPDACVLCGEPLTASHDARTHSAHDVIDLILPSKEQAGLQVVQIKQVYLARRCGCGHWTAAQPAHQEPADAWTVALSERHLAGPLLVALICALALRMRLSRRRIQEFLADWLGLSLGLSTINQCVHEAGRALAPVEEQLLTEVRSSELLHADETSWIEHGHLLWLWVFTNATTTLFRIGRRSQELLRGVLGPRFDGWLMSDGYWAYREHDQRLRCLAHLLRKARGIEESLDRSVSDFGRTLREHLEALMESVYAAREGPPPQPLRQQHAAAFNALFARCLAHAESRHAKTRALARELLNDWDTFWVVLDHPDLPLTNNRAERALRHWVIARRIGYGTRHAQGSRVFATLASVIETCRQRGHSPWTFIAEVMRERRQGRPAPILPPAVA